MRIYSFLLILSSWFLTLSISSAQEVEERNKSGYHDIITALMSPTLGGGQIRIFQSAFLRGLIHTKERIYSPMNVNGVEYQTYQGYKVQAYSGNRADSKSLVASRALRIRNDFPELDIQTIYEAPFWHLHVGNFLNREEAVQCLQQLRLAFPDFGKEMYVVRSSVKVAL